MNKNKELIKNTIIIFMGRASTQLISLFLLPLYTSYIITSEFGIVDLITTYISLIVPVITLELDMATFRFLVDCRNDEYGKSKVLTNVTFCIFVVIPIFIILFLIINYFIKFMYSYLILFAIIANIFSTILIQVARGLGKNIDYSIVCIVGGIITIISNIILIVLLKFGGDGMLISMIISNLSMAIYLIVRTKLYKYINSKFINFKYIKKLLKYSIPLIPNLISWWFVSVSDRTIISSILGSSINGIYSIANKFPTIYNGVYNVFHLSWSEQASIHFNEEDKDLYFSSIINNGIQIFGSICILIIAFLPLIFDFLIDSTYGDAYYQIPILMMGTLCNTIIGLISVIYIAKKLSKELSKTSIIAAVINVLTHLVLIKFIGLYAASVSTFIAYFSMMIFRWFDVKKYIDIKLNKKSAILLILGLLYSSIVYYINNVVLCISSLLIVSIIVILINKNIVIIFLKRFNIGGSNENKRTIKKDSISYGIKKKP